MSERAPAPPPPDHSRLDPTRAGLAALAGYGVWGLSPIFYKFLDFAGATEIALHRAVWSVPTLLAILILAGRLAPAMRVFADRRALLVLPFTAALIAANWWTFIYAVGAERVLEVSLGYFISPLMNVAVGVCIAGERFGRWRAVAVGLAALGVLNQIVTVGELPLVALFLAASFTVYGYVRKTIQVDGRIGLFWESAIIAVPSLVALTFLEAGAQGRFFDGPYEALTGPMTVAPLLLFILGARGLTFATLGVLQFLAPTLQFTVGLAWGEPFGLAHFLTFALIWSGLAVFVGDLLSFERKTRRAPQEV